MTGLTACEVRGERRAAGRHRVAKIVSFIIPHAGSTAPRAG
jgi:hypothetical protein